MLGSRAAFPFCSRGRERWPANKKKKIKLKPSPVPLFQPRKWKTALLALTITTEQKQIQAPRSPGLPKPASFGCSCRNSPPARPPAAALCSPIPEFTPQEGAFCSVYWQILLFPVSRRREEPQFPVCSDFPKPVYPISTFVIMGFFFFHHAMQILSIS